MRGIGIQISRLEISKTKKNKGSLMNFFNKKTEKAQACDETLESDSKSRHDSHFSEGSKTDANEATSTAKSSSTTKSTSDMKTDNSSSELARLSDSNGGARDDRHVAIPPVVQAETSTTAIEAKSKKSHNRKANENAIARGGSAKESSAKSGKKANIQKQASQEKFFRHVKPSSSGKSSKYEMPRIQDIDMSVLIELPDDIRNEILNEYKRSKEQSRVDAAAVTANKATDSANEATRGSSDPRGSSCSQVDPDILSTLMTGDLHPDVQRDVQMYCDMKRQANNNGRNVGETNDKYAGDSNKLIERVADPSSRMIRDNGENARPVVDNNDVKKATRLLQGEKMPTHAWERSRDKDERAEASTACCQPNRNVISRNDAATDNADIFILQNLSILHNNENVDKHQEMLINLVNHLFTLPLQQVPHNHSLRQKVSNRN